MWNNIRSKQQAASTPIMMIGLVQVDMFAHGYLNDLNSTLIQQNNTFINGTKDSSSEGLVMEWFWIIVKSIYFNAIMSGLFAGAVTIFVTVIIEKFGPQIGGVIATVPSAIVPALIGFCIDADKNYSEEPEVRKHVLIQQFFSVPIAVFCNISMMLVWKYLPPLIDRLLDYVNKKRGKKIGKELNDVELHMEHEHGETVEHKDGVMDEKLVEKKVEPNKRIVKLLVVCTISLLVWFSFAAVFVVVTKIVTMDDEVLIGVSMGFFAIMLVISIACNWVQHVGKSGPAKKVAWWLLLSRGILAFAIICLAVLMSGLKLTFISGVFSVFPAVSLTSMLSLWLSQGEVPTSNAASTMMVGSAALPVFAVGMCICLWYLNWVFSLAIGYAVSVMVALLAYAFLWWRKKVATKKMEETKQPADSAINN